MIDQNGKQLGIMNLSQALSLAEAANLDLVEVAPNASPPVCRIMNYGKYKYQLKKKKGKQSKGSQSLKEIRFRPSTDEHDIQIKIKKVMEFLKSNHKVKLTIRFRGRELAYKKVGYEVLKRIADSLSDIANVEHEPKEEGRNMSIILAPKSK